MISASRRPCIIAGGALTDKATRALFKRFVSMYRIPVVTSMLRVDILDSNHPLRYGFIGAYGDRTANFVIAKSDLVIALGSRLDIRQVGPTGRILRQTQRLSEWILIPVNCLTVFMRMKLTYAQISSAFWNV